MFLNFGEDGHNRNCNTEDEVQADEDLVLCAAVRLSVEDVEQCGRLRLVGEEKAGGEV